MTFYESQLNAKQYVDMALNETATAEFYTDINNGVLKVTYNNKRPMDIKDFLILAKRDPSAYSILNAVKKKMDDVNYKGNLLDFITRFFKYGNQEKLDVVVKDGYQVKTYNGKIDTFYTDPEFDDNEFDLGIKNV